MCVGGLFFASFGELVVKQFIYPVLVNPPLSVLTQYKGRCVRVWRASSEMACHKLIRSKFSHMTYINTKVPGKALEA